LGRFPVSRTVLNHISMLPETWQLRSRKEFFNSDKRLACVADCSTQLARDLY
jgi:hypothetical protein